MCHPVAPEWYDLLRWCPGRDRLRHCPRRIPDLYVRFISRLTGTVDERVADVFVDSDLVNFPERLGGSEYSLLHAIAF